MQNGMFDRMCKEAQKDLADGDKGWRDVSPNVLIMACFGILSNHLAHKLLRPLWFFGGAVATGVIWLIISDLFIRGVGG